MRTRVLLAVVSLLLLTTTLAHGGPAVGLQGVRYIFGFSYRFRDLEQHAFTPQVLGRAYYLSPYRIDLALGLRGLYSLGKQGSVQRYTGIGAGYMCESYDGRASHKLTTHALFGLELEFPFRPTPSIPFKIKLSLEGTFDGTTTIGRGWTAGTGVGAGLHYQF